MDAAVHTSSLYRSTVCVNVCVYVLIRVCPRCLYPALAVEAAERCRRQQFIATERKVLTPAALVSALI